MANPTQLLQTAFAHHRAGRIDKAEPLYRQLLRLRPNDVDALHLLGEICRRQKHYDEAIALLRRAIKAKPDFPMAYFNLAGVYFDQGDMATAADCYRQATVLKTDYADAYVNLGVALQRLGQLEAATDAFDRAASLAPDSASAHGNLGTCLRLLGRWSEAEAAYGRAIALNPNMAAVHAGLGHLLRILSRLGEAETAYRRALTLDPNQPDIVLTLALAVQDQGRIDEAEALFRQDVAAFPNHAEGHCSLGNLLCKQHRLEEGIEAYRQALKARSDFATALFSLVHRRLHICDWDGLDADEEALRRCVRDGAGGALPYIFFMVKGTAEEQYLCARNWAAAYRAPFQFPAPAPRPGEKIRLAYISADFRNHATSYLACEMFERHDRTRFEVIAYSYSPQEPGAFPARVRQAFDRFVEIGGMAAEQAARHIHDDGIDILVDMMGGTGNTALPILAYRPAPIQVNFLVSPGTLGADWVDYILLDPVVVPDTQIPFLAEKPVRLPHCYQPNDTRREIAGQPASRGECGLPEQGFVFCSFNNSFKIRPEFFAAWMRLLQAVPGSVLWLLEANNVVERNLRREAQARGVESERLIFAPKLPLPRHMARHRLADLFLDTQPYNAHTTASDALWMTLPVVTCLGATFPGRVAASLLQAIGLDDLVTRTLEDYESLALALATRPTMLADVRRRLAANRLTTPLFDTPRFTRNIEAAFGRMWDLWAAGEAPRAFDVQDEAHEQANAPC